MAEAEAAAKKLILLYTEFAREAAYAGNPSYVSYTGGDAIMLVDPVKMPFGLGDAASAQADEPRGVAASLLLGAVAGLAAGLIAAAVIYFADPRVKSFALIAQGGGVLLARSRESSPDAGAALNIAAKTNGAKTLLIAAAGDDAFANALAEAVCGEFTAAGLKTLFIDLITTGTDAAAFDGYLSGAAKTAPAPEPGVRAYMASRSRDGWTRLMSEKARFAELAAGFDKTVVSFNDFSRGGATVLGGVCDKTALVVDQKRARLADVASLINDLRGGRADDADGAVIGTYIHNAI
jgi:hypothetical protein